MPTEQILFNKGLAYDARSALQQSGFLQAAVNIDFKKDGEQSLRPQFAAINPTAINAIHSIQRFRDRLFIGDSSYLRHQGVAAFGDFTSLGSTFKNAILSFQEYKDFLIAVNGTDSVMFDEDGNLYNTVIANPATAATLTDSTVAGNPSDTYVGYVTYLITFPNGHKYETGFSSASSDVVVSSEKIAWSSIPVSTYEAVSGTAPTIHRKLYRGPGTLGSLADIYLVATIEDNTTTTYTDNISDTTLAANGASYVDDYTTMPVPLYQAFHYGRWFTIREAAAYKHRLYYSEAAAGATGVVNELLMPIAIQSTNWDDIRVAAYGRCDPQGLIAWGTYIYVPMKHTWLRKYGNDPDTWSFKKTWSEIGISAPYSIAECGKPTGILGVSMRGKTPGISLFNGQLSQIISSPKFDALFEEDLNQDYIHKCRGAWDGRYYHLLYPSGANTEPDKWAAFDLSRYPDIRLAYWEDLSARSLAVDEQSTRVYIGGSDGKARQNSGTETIDVEVKTHDLVGDPKIANHTKTLIQLKYAIDTGGEGVTLELYIDGSLITFSDDTQSKTISGSDDTPQYIKDLPVNAEGYSYSARITGSDLSTFIIYSPWILEFEVK